MHSQSQTHKETDSYTDNHTYTQTPRYSSNPIKQTQTDKHIHILKKFANRGISYLINEQSLKLTLPNTNNEKHNRTLCRYTQNTLIYYQTLIKKYIETPK